MGLLVGPWKYVRRKKATKIRFAFDPHDYLHVIKAGDHLGDGKLIILGEDASTRN